jgi:hypothetical protein
MSEEQNDSNPNGDQQTDSNLQNTSIEQPENPTTNMEVHHHPDLHHKPKKWKEYFLEFLMIFLAVTLGFIAENIREGIVDSAKERHYMESLVTDLRNDTAEMSVVVTQQKYFITKMDSSLEIPVEKLTDISCQDTFYHHFIYYYSWVFLFFNHDNTLTQLKNAAGFNVIHDNEVIDSIGNLNLFYEQQVKLNGNYYNEFWKKVVETGAHLMKLPEPPVLLSDPIFDIIPKQKQIFTHSETALLEELYTWIRNEKGTLLVYIDNELKYRGIATRLMDLIIRKYKLEK